MEHLELETRASLPKLNDKSKLQLMEGSVFYKLLKMKKRNHNLVITRLIMETYDIDKKAFFIGNKWCILCEAEVAFLLGLKPNGKYAEEKPAGSVVPQFFTDLASQVSLNTTYTNHLMKKKILQKILDNTVLNEENRDSLRNLIYFHLLNFFLFPSSGLNARLKFFSYDIHDIEETNWAKVLLELVINDICDFKKSSIVEGKKTYKYLKFFAPLLEAWFYYRTNSIEDQILANPDDAPVSFCQIKSTKSDSLKSDFSRLTPEQVKSKCSLCEDKEESLSKEAATTSAAGGLKLETSGKSITPIRKASISSTTEANNVNPDGIENLVTISKALGKKMASILISDDESSPDFYGVDEMMECRSPTIHGETSGDAIVLSATKASVSSTTERHKSDSPTTNFEGFDIRSDLVPTLQKIWQKHGNIIKDRTERNRDIVARALESLGTMVRILEENPAQSLSDVQANYLRSTLSDLERIHFKVCWLVLFVEKALLVHKSKPLVESLDNLNQLNSEVEEDKAILLDKLAKLYEKQSKLKEEIVKVSKMIPFSGQVKFDKPIGAGLT